MRLDTRDPIIRVLEKSKFQPGPLETECRVWTGATDTKGYGQLSVANRLQLAHRVAWVAENGPIPAETPFVLHRCDVPRCFRVEHLFLGDNAVNVADKVSKNRQYRAPLLEACCRGHRYDEINTYYRPKGGRGCRACRAINMADYQRRRRARAGV